MATALWMSAGEQGKPKIKLAANQAKKTIRAFWAQSGAEVLFVKDAASGAKIKAIEGVFSPAKAGNWMVAGTTLYPNP